MNPIQITVGGGGNNPADGTTEYNNTDLAGTEGYVSRSGYGTWDYTNYQVLSTGGFRLLNGFKFKSGEVWFFHPTGVQYNTAVVNYTNGFDYNKVMNVMFTRIGWRQTTKSGYSSLVNTLNQTSTSGRYYDDFHAACNAYNLYLLQDDSGLGTTGFNSYLESITQSVIMRALTGVFSEEEYIEQVLLYDRNILNSVEEPISNEGNFVGYTINISPSFDKAIQLNAVTLLFDTDCTFTLHLFKEGKKSSIWTKEVSVVANEATIVNISDLVLNYIDTAVKGTRYYLGYFQSEIAGQNAKAINETNVCWNKTLSFGAVPFYAPEVTGNFNRTAVNTACYGRTFGMNLEMSSFRNWTQKIIKRPNVFDELIGLCMAYRVIEQIVYSPRSNMEKLHLMDGISLPSLISDLNGSAPITDGPPPITGLNKRIDREIARVKESLFDCERSQIVDLC